MRKKLADKLFYSSIYLPIFAEKDEDGFYIVECPLLDGCYTQGKTLNEALKNIKEVIKLCLEETQKKDFVEAYKKREYSFHTVNFNYSNNK